MQNNVFFLFLCACFCNVCTFGLYTALVPPVGYMLCGTCSQLSLGVS